MNPNPVNLYWKRKDGLLSRKEREYIDGSPSCRREFERIDELLSTLPWKEPPSPPLLPEGFFPEPLSLWQRLLYPTAVAAGLSLGLLLGVASYKADTSHKAPTTMASLVTNNGLGSVQTFDWSALEVSDER